MGTHRTRIINTYENSRLFASIRGSNIERAQTSKTWARTNSTKSLKTSAPIRGSKIERAQMLNYLKITKLEVGLILNFKRPKLEYERIVLNH